MPLCRHSLLAVAVLALTLAPGCGQEEDPGSQPRPRTSPPLFAPNSFWNRPLPAGAPISSASGRLVAELRRQLATSQPWINTWQFSAPVYRVGARQRRVRVRLDTRYPRLAKAFAAVPLPRGAAAATGNDRHLVVWQPATDTMWEFFKLRRRGDGWHARWGGRMRRVSRAKGVFRAPLGATASGLPLAGGLIRPSELRRGRIDHVLAFSLPHARAKAFSPPATRTDGNKWTPGAIPMGTRFRLDPKLDLDKLALPRPTLAIARAVQRYGMVARDKGGAVAFYAEAPKPGRRNPYPRLFGGRYPNELLRRFPWERLQAVRARVIKRWQAVP